MALLRSRSLDPPRAVSREGAGRSQTEVRVCAHKSERGRQREVGRRRVGRQGELSSVGHGDTRVAIWVFT